jgi:peptidoglycan/LPS O-acetylase OafA/YrhL
LAYVFFGFVLTIGINYYLGLGIYGFFMGGIVFRYHNFLASFAQVKKVICFLVVQLIIASTVFYFLTDSVNKRDLALLSCITFSPALILMLAYFQTIGAEFGRSMIIIGDLTYSTYLLHFPIQIIMNVVHLKFGIFPPDSQRTFVIFVLITFFVSFFVYRYFELELKNRLRRVLGD